MKSIRNIAIILFSGVLFASNSCRFGNKKNEPIWSDLPEVTNLDNLKQTDIVTTLESPISENKNVIYTPTFLFAWDKIKNEINSSIILDSTNSQDFKLLNNSILHQGSLGDDEYFAEVETVDGAVTVKAFFKKTLQFEEKMEVLDEPIDFGTTKVSAFGMFYYNESLIKFTQIVYYKDDDNFILRLVPKDTQHEIILAKGLGEYETLKDAVELCNGLIAKGKQEQADARSIWKYQIVQKDIFAIPSIIFNISTHYQNIEGQNFSTIESRRYSVETAYQRTGFIFNENGAVIDDQVAAVADSASVEPIITHPKKMIFDKPFLIMIKHVGKTNPYFILKVTNAELLIRK